MPFHLVHLLVFSIDVNLMGLSEILCTMKKRLIVKHCKIFHYIELCVFIAVVNVSAGTKLYFLTLVRF